MWVESLSPWTPSQKFFLLTCAGSQPSHVTAHVRHLQKLILVTKLIYLIVIVHDIDRINTLRA